MKLLLVLGLLMGCLSQSQNMESLKGHKLLKCMVNSRDNLAALESAGDVQKFYGSRGYAIVHSRSSQEEDSLNKLASCSVLKQDMGIPSHPLTLDSRILKIGNYSKDPFFLNYQSYKSIVSKLEKWSKDYSNLTHYTKSIGKTHEARDIPSFEIRSNSYGKKKSIWFNGGLHAREWISPATVMYIISELLENYSKDKRIKDILDKFSIHFTPVSNPDGYEYSRSGDRLWRKNRRMNEDQTYGVDLNRNFDEWWGVIGSSNVTTDETYHGPSALSEPETRSLSDFGLNLHAYAGIDFHSYGQLILRSWGFKVKTPATNEKYLKTLGDGMSKIYKENGYDYTSELSAGLYPAGGAMDDWMAAKAKMQAYTVELCPVDDAIGFLLPPTEIVNCASATYNAVLYFFEYLAENYNLPPNQPIPEKSR